MSTDDLAAAVDANLVAVWRSLPPTVPGGHVLDGDGFVLVDTCSPIPAFNAAFVTAPIRDPDALLDAVRAYFEPHARSFMIWCRADLPSAEAVRETALLRGFTDGGKEPGMALHPIPGSPSTPAGLTIEEITDPDAVSRHASLAAEGFGAPAEELARLFSGRLLDVARVFVGSVDGTDVATAISMVTGDVAGIYSVATLEPHRSRGFGEALTWAAVAAGREAGCDVATLQASALGRPVYERMGFRTVVEYLQLMWTGPQA